LDLGNSDAFDVVLLCSKPFQVAMRSTKLKAYGDHFTMENPKSRLLQTFDNGIALVFEHQIIDVKGMFIPYVGVLKNILKLNYGQVQTPIVIFRCEWMKQEDNQRKLTYVKDDVRFFTINFRHRLMMTFDTFIFPSQVTRVFFYDDFKKLGWKVVLWKEACF
jgi:hypothetical protein